MTAQAERIITQRSSFVCRKDYMNRKSSELKALAREALLGHYSLLVRATLFYYLLSMILQGLSEKISIQGPEIVQIGANLLVQLIVSLLLALLGVGFLHLTMNLLRGKTCRIADLFYAFTHQPDRFIIVSFILTLIQTLCQLPASYNVILVLQNPANIGNGLKMLLYLLIGIIVSVILLLPLALSQILLLDNEDLGAVASLRESVRLMKGNKGRYLYIEMSFIGLCILTVFTLFIGMLWIYPYMVATEVFFYMDVTGELDRTPNPEPQFTGYAEDYWR